MFCFVEVRCSVSPRTKPYLNSLFLPSYQTVPEPVLLIPPPISHLNRQAKFHPEFSAFIILVLELTQKLSPPFLPGDSELSCRPDLSI